MPFGGMLTVGAISAGTQLLGGILGNQSANKAQQILLQKGEQAAGAIDKATGQAIDAGYAGMAGANDALDTGLNNANDAVNTGVNQSVSMTDPYRQAGASAVGSLSDLAHSGPVTMADLQIDPGFAFRLQQGQQALERSAAARGSSMSGGTLKGLTRYSQGVASDEYGKAFDRFQQDRAARAGMLSSVAGMGQNAVGQAIGATMSGAGQVSGNYMNNAGTKANVSMNGNQYVGNVGLQGAEAAGNARMGAGNGAASAAIAGGNIWNNTLSNMGQTAQDLYLYNLLSKPAAGGGGNPPLSGDYTLGIPGKNATGNYGSGWNLLSPGAGDVHAFGG